MIFWSKKIGADLAMELVRLCISVMVEQEGDDCDKVSPAGGRECYLDTMQIHGNRVIIWYNDKTGTTKSAEIETGVLL